MAGAITTVDVGADYLLVVDGLESFTVRSIDPDTGATLATDAAVSGVKRITNAQEWQIGEGGLGAQTCAFVLVASTLSFTPKTRDYITDNDGGNVWEIVTVTRESDEKIWNCTGNTLRR